MEVREVMTSSVECVRPDTTVQKAAQKMRDLDVGPLPVCSDEERLVGIVTDRDIAIRSAARGDDPKSTRIEDVMTPGIIHCFADQSVEDAAAIMKEHQIRRLVVLNRDKKLVGIVSLGDLAVDTGDEALAGEALEVISEPVHH